MSSKLKRKLNDLGVDTQSRAVAENFCLIGTPLPPLEKSKDNGEFVPIWKQDVRDEKGRRRLHGAFTGGFSAGYFNSVGSKEGWAPSTFVSSRADRAKKKAARPEDFMDEEDLAEIRDNQKLVGTTDEMDLEFWSRRKSEGTEEQDSMTGALEAALLPAPRDSVGARILKKMGWRLGHGVGPKVTYEQRKRQAALSSNIMEGEVRPPDTEDHEEATKHLYPPRDTKVPSFARKDDKHGLGYTTGLGLTDLMDAGAADSKGQTAVKGPNISAGFGLGALNDAEEDDLDVYDRGLDTGNRRLAYEAEGDEQHIIMGSREKDRSSGRPIAMQPSRVANQFSGQQITFSDGTPCLPGFVVSNKRVVEDAWFPPPKVPEGWTPNPQKVWNQAKENISTSGRPDDDKDTTQRNSLTHSDRGNLLGEAPQAPRSVFDYLSAKDRDRLQNIAEGRDRPQEQRQDEPGPLPAPGLESSIPRLDPQVAKMALQGFQPFTADPVKQARYTAYLRAQAEAADTVPFGRMPGQAADSFQRELEDYARSAQIFKPVSGAMAGRFTRAAVLETGTKAQEGLHRPADQNTYLSTPGHSEEAEKPKEESPKENAARLGMYGPLTREAKPWRPAKLLCKRFGVKEPEVELETENTTASASSANRQNSSALAITNGTEAALTGSTQIRGEGDVPEASSSTGPRWSGRDIENIGLGENEQQGKEILSYERPAMDIFKAIFASDDEDAGEDLNPDNDETREDDVPEHREDRTVKDTVEAPTMSSAPAVAVNYADAAGKIDLSSFKPTFVPREKRQKADENGKKLKDKHKEKKKKGKSTLVSFEVDEGVEAPDERKHGKERTEKKRKKKKDVKEPVAGDDEDSMWVEKPVPEAVQKFLVTAPFVPPASAEGPTETEGGPHRGRKRAIDFL